MEDYEGDSEQLKCNAPGCGKLLSSKYNLKRHIESCHLGSRPYECHFCYKCFSSKQNKREHIRLKHSYGTVQDTEERNRRGIVSESISIFRLSRLLSKSDDPDIRPFSKVERIYMYADLNENIEIPKISKDRQSVCELPPYRA